MSYWSLHTHSRHSRDDALSPVEQLVERAVELGYPALGLTDHGTMAGAVALYTAGKKAGLPVLPGIEMYLTPLHESREQRSMHLTMAAYTGEGYRNLVALANQAHRQVYYRPRLDLADLAAAAEAGATQGIAVATGCRSGPVVRALTERGEGPAEQVAKALAGWFPRAYVELMNHHFKADGITDDEICDALAAIAQRAGLPCILTGDAHYTWREDRDAHDALKTMTTFSADPEDGKFSGEGYWLLDPEALDPWQPGFEGLTDLAEAAEVAIPELDSFSLKIPDVTFGKDPDAELQRLVDERAVAKPPKNIADRQASELEVIKATEMAPYLLLVEKITSFMEREGIWYYARGSVAGSRVCYDLGISATDPVFWGIRMERFLSGDRTSPPDIDLDIEHERRGEVVAMLEAEGYELVQVGTQLTYGLTKNEEDGQEKGSLLVKYFSVLGKQGVKDTSWESTPESDKKLLRDLAERGLVYSIGAHPGGYVVARDKPTIAALPLVRIDSSGTVVTAFTKGEVEAMGFPKIDMLGSKVLTALKHSCMAATGLDTYGARDWYRQIPLDDKPTLKRVSAGKTAGLFQLSGWTNRKVCQAIKPRKTADIVAVQALGRPAPMKSGFTDEFLARRDKHKPVPQMHADIAAETSDTYGLAIYQEQVVGMLRRIGVPPQQLTKLLKAVKASGKVHVVEARAIVADALEEVRHLAEQRGWSDVDVEYLTGCLVDYGAGYSFGKGHSVTYGVAAYNTAWMATHHSLEFWTGMLNAYTGSKNSRGEPLEPMYVRAAREDEIRVKDPSVSRSGLGYTFDAERREITKGLLSIRNVGEAAAQAIMSGQPYSSVQDFCQRMAGKVGGAKGVVYLATEIEFMEYLDKHSHGALAGLFDDGAFGNLPYGTAIRKAKGRKRRCEQCKTTFPSPLDYELHVEEVHDVPAAAQPGAAQA